MGQCLSVEIDDAYSCHCIYKVDVRPSLFSKRKGSKSFLPANIQVYWDLCSAKFGPGPGPEPLEGYYIAVVCKGEMVLVVGDLRKEAFKKTGVVASSLASNAVLVSKREHILGKRVFQTKAQFWDNGKVHDLKIEYDDNGGDSDGDPRLVVRVDAKTVVQVRHLQWKFRGNCAILVDGMQVEVFWDVHDWLFGSCVGNAVFMFRTTLEMDKIGIMSLCDSPVLSWSGSMRFGDAELPGFCLCLYAWKSE